MLDAQELFTQTWVRTENKWSAAFSFRRIAQLGLPHATEQLLAENVQLALGFLTEPEYERIFVDQGKFLEVAGGLDGIGKTLTDKQVVDFVAAVDAASLVFHHSLVDSAALDYCRVTALVAPGDWEPFVLDKKISVADLKAKTPEELVNEKVEDDLNRLDRDSLLKKVDRLLALSKPEIGFAPIREYTWEPDRLKRLDKERHDVVHGSDPLKPLPTIEEDLEFLHKTAIYMMALVNHRYDVRMDPAYMAKLYGALGSGDPTGES